MKNATLNGQSCLACIAFALLFAAGCSLIQDTDDASYDLEFGRSVSGIRISDDTTEVYARLGRPVATLIGDFDGFVHFYEVQGIEAIAVTFRPDHVAGVVVYATYAGKTRDGIGIGTPYEIARPALGEPDQVMKDINGRQEIYEYAGGRGVTDIAFIVDYEEEVLSRILMIARD